MIGIGIIVILVIGIFTFKYISGANNTENISPTPTPTPSYKGVDENVEASISIRTNGKYVDLVITGLAGKYSALEYELSYDTEIGPKGSIGREKGKPIKLSEGQDEFEREVELGSCSTGGKCSYYTGVKNFKIVVKFYDENDEVYVLRKSFEDL